MVKNWVFKQGGERLVAFAVAVVLTFILLAGFGKAGNSTLEIASVNNSMFFLNSLDCIRFQNTSFNWFTVCSANNTITQNVTVFVNQTIPVIVNNTVFVEKNITTVKRLDKTDFCNFGERLFDYESNYTILCPEKLNVEKELECGSNFTRVDYGLNLTTRRPSDCGVVRASELPCPVTNLTAYLEATGFNLTAPSFESCTAFGSGILLEQQRNFTLDCIASAGAVCEEKAQQANSDLFTRFLGVVFFVFLLVGLHLLWQSFKNPARGGSGQT